MLQKIIILWKFIFTSGLIFLNQLAFFLFGALPKHTHDNENDDNNNKMINAEQRGALALAEIRVWVGTEGGPTQCFWQIETLFVGATST